MNELIALTGLIDNVAFPVAVVIYMFYFQQTTLKGLITAVNSLTQTIAEMRGYMKHQEGD